MKKESTSVQTSISLLNPERLLYKIFGREEFNFQLAYSQSKVDWSGFYTQLNPQHSMRYLTKKWDDGANEACLVLLKARQTLKLITLHNNEFFSNPKISGEQKALRVKQILRKKSSESQKFKDFHMKNEDILIRTLGKKQTLMECIDMEDNEIIIPHELLNEKYFQFQNLMKFKRSSDGLLRTIGWGWSARNKQDAEWKSVKGQAQYEPYMILKEEGSIKDYLNGIQRFS